MNAAERIARTIYGEPADRVPVIPQLFAWTGIRNGVSIENYIRSGETAARCQLKEWRKYGHDALFSCLGTSVESEALGAQLKYSPDHYPHTLSFPVTPETSIEALVLPDPCTAGRMPEQLKATEILRHTAGDEALTVGSVTGPMTTAVQLMGAETALFAAADTPDFFEKLLDFSAETAIRFGKAQLEQGAHVIMIFDPSSSPEMIPPPFFRELIIPRLKRLCTAFRKMKENSSWLHIAGRVQPILPFYPETGVDIANFDYPVSPQEAAELLPATCLDGNIKSWSFVSASAGSIRKEAYHLLNLFSSRKRFILSSGCEIPPEAPPENIAAMTAATGEWPLS